MKTLDKLIVYFFLLTGLVFPYYSNAQDARPDTKKILPTHKISFPTPFNLLNNLYFNADSGVFFSSGDDVDPNHVISPNFIRGYSFHVASKRDLLNLKYRRKTIEGTSLFLFEIDLTRHYLSHFFHLLEHLVGVWSFYGADNFNDIKLIVLASDGSRNKDPTWKGPNSINEHLLKAMFPQASVKTWDEFLVENHHTILRFEKAFTSDRALTFYSEACSRVNKMLAEAFPDLSSQALNQLALRVNSYANTQSKASNLITVTYLKRPFPRALEAQLEQKLINAIEQLPNVKLTVIDFFHISFQEQINVIGKTDVLISVHGNGLSHILFLPETSSVIEIFPKDSCTLDYRMFADARNIEYLGIICNRGILKQEEAYSIGVMGNTNTTIYELNIEPIISLIKDRAK